MIDSGHRSFGGSFLAWPPRNAYDSGLAGAVWSYWDGTADDGGDVWLGARVNESEHGEVRCVRYYQALSSFAASEVVVETRTLSTSAAVSHTAWYGAASSASSSGSLRTYEGAAPDSFEAGLDAWLAGTFLPPALAAARRRKLLPRAKSSAALGASSNASKKSGAKPTKAP